MNINPSDTDVRQGFTLAQSVMPAQSSATATAAPGLQRTAAQSSPATGTATGETEAKSNAAASAADRQTALETAQKLGKQLEDSGTGLKIRVLDDSQNRVQVEIVDQQSNKVLRKIPQDDLLKLSASIKEMTGVLLNNPA